MGRPNRKTLERKKDCTVITADYYPAVSNTLYEEAGCYKMPQTGCRNPAVGLAVQTGIRTKKKKKKKVYSYTQTHTHTNTK